MCAARYAAYKEGESGIHWHICGGRKEDEETAWVARAFVAFVACAISAYVCGK